MTWTMILLKPPFLFPWNTCPPRLTRRVRPHRPPLPPQVPLFSSTSFQFSMVRSGGRNEYVLVLVLTRGGMKERKSWWMWTIPRKRIKSSVTSPPTIVQKSSSIGIWLILHSMSLLQMECGVRRWRKRYEKHPKWRSWVPCGCGTRWTPKLFSLPVLTWWRNLDRKIMQGYSLLLLSNTKEFFWIGF